MKYDGPISRTGVNVFFRFEDHDVETVLGWLEQVRRGTKQDKEGTFFKP